MLYAILAYHVETDITSLTAQEDAALMTELNEVRDRLTSFASPAYGPIAFGTSARAPYLTDWPDGGYIGIHGTNEPQLIPGRISHGCIRLTDAAIVKLAQLMPVGTPVTIT